MSASARIGAVTLKNPVIAGAAEHLIDADGVRRAFAAGVGAVVVKSVNESQTARDQLKRAEYTVLDEQWRPVAWGPDAPPGATIACRSGMSPLAFEPWLEQVTMLDREAKAFDSYAVASVIMAGLEPAVEMIKQIDQAGLRILELNIGTPYASQAGKGVVSTELKPERITEIVSTVRAATKLPLWVKITGQSERVPELARAAFEAGGDSVVMAGRLLGLVPDVETFAPMLNSTLGVGGFWNLPLTCYWLAESRTLLGPDKPLIGVNGAQSGLDVARMMLAGASAVEIASPVMLRGFEVLSNAVTDFAAYLKAKNINAADLIGRAADQRKKFFDFPILDEHWRNYIPR